MWGYLIHKAIKVGTHSDISFWVVVIHERRHLRRRWRLHKQMVPTYQSFHSRYTVISHLIHTNGPWRRKWQPTPVLLPREFHGQRNPAGYSPRGRKELDRTEHAYHTHTLRFYYHSSPQSHTILSSLSSHVPYSSETTAGMWILVNQWRQGTTLPQIQHGALWSHLTTVGVSRMFILLNNL